MAALINLIVLGITLPTGTVPNIEIVECTGIPREDSRFFFTLPAVVTVNDVIDPKPVL